MCKENTASKENANSSQLKWEISCHMLTTTVRKQGFIGDFSKSTCPVSRVCYNYMEFICEHRTVDSMRSNFTIRKKSKWGRAQYSGHFLDVWFVLNPFNSKLNKTYCASVRPQWLTHTVCLCELCQGWCSLRRIGANKTLFFPLMVFVWIRGPHLFGIKLLPLLLPRVSSHCVC